jgi:hypothetical protein
VWQERAQEAQELAKQQLEEAARATQSMVEPVFTFLRQPDYSSPLPTTVFSSRKRQIPVTSFSSRKRSPGRIAKISDPDLVALNPVYSWKHDFFGIAVSVTECFF